MPRTANARLVAILAAWSLVQVGCGGSSPDAPAVSPDPFPVHVNHVLIVVLENHSYEDILGNTKDMPYLNGLATTYAYATAYYADSHPSLPNYFILTTGQRIVNGVDEHPGAVTDDNVVRHLGSAGKTWKAYSESLPSAGYIGGDSGAYQERFNPISYFSDVRDNTSESINLVPFSQFAVDLANHVLPDYSWIDPDQYDNGHSCPLANPSCTDDQKLATADAWLQTNLDPLISSPDFNAPGGGLLIITFDESEETDTAHGGGHVPWILVGPDIKKGYTSTTLYQHESTLRFMMQVIGLESFPGSAGTAPEMREFLAN